MSLEIFQRVIGHTGLSARFGRRRQRTRLELQLHEWCRDQVIIYQLPVHDWGVQTPARPVSDGPLAQCIHTCDSLARDTAVKSSSRRRLHKLITAWRPRSRPCAAYSAPRTKNNRSISAVAAAGSCLSRLRLNACHVEFLTEYVYCSEKYCWPMWCMYWWSVTCDEWG